MNVRFEVKNPYGDQSDRARAVRSILDYSDIELMIHVTYDEGNEESEASIIQLVRFLAEEEANAKFGLDYYPYQSMKRRDEGAGKISFVCMLPRVHGSALLILLSMVSDAMSYLASKGVSIESDMLGILTMMSDAYRVNQEDNCACAKLVEKLMCIIMNNPSLSDHDAILLAYCFLSLPQVEIPIIASMSNITETLQAVLQSINKDYTSLSDSAIEKNENAIEKAKADNKALNESLDEFLNKLILCHKIKLYRPCLGKHAHDGGLYQWTYTEWDFLRGAKFELVAKNDMVINVARDAKVNKGYAKYYAPGKKNHDIFVNEFHALTPLTGLAFPAGINMHDMITFTQETLKILCDLNLFFDRDAVKAVVKAKKSHCFFEQATRSGDLFVNLPADVIKLIFAFAYGPLISNKELLEPEYVREVIAAPKV